MSITETKTNTNAAQVSLDAAIASIAVESVTGHALGNYGLAHTCLDAPLTRSEKSDLLRQLNDKARANKLALFTELPGWVRTSLPRHFWAATRSGERVESTADLLTDAVPEEWKALFSPDGEFVRMTSTHRGVDVKTAADPAWAIFTIDATEFETETGKRNYTKKIALSPIEYGPADKNGKRAALKWRGACPVVSKGGKVFTLEVRGRKVDAETIRFRTTLQTTPPSPDEAVKNS
jgi:hypothetical protein